MESKPKLWRRKPSEKAFTKERVLELERSLQKLIEQLSIAHYESATKDVLIVKQIKVSEEATAGWEKAKAESASFKLELDDAVHQNTIMEEKVASIDTAMKNCTQQLHALKDEHQNSINDFTVKLLQEREEAQDLQNLLADSNQKIQHISVEKHNLCAIIEAQEKSINDLYVAKSQLESDLASITERLDFSKKSCRAFEYDILILQKELVIRNQERELNLRSAKCAQKQHTQNVRRINRLESECHRLRGMIRKRLPSPAYVSRMRTEGEILDISAPETRRKSNQSLTVSSVFLPEINEIDRFNRMEDENRVLKETLAKKNSELQLSRIMFAHTNSNLSQAEKKLKELSIGTTCLELALVSEDAGNEDDASSSMSHLERFRIENLAITPHRSIGSSHSSLMDDFEEMEKLAIICTDKLEEASSRISGDDPTYFTPKSHPLKPVLRKSCDNDRSEKDNFPFHLKLESAIHRIIELIEAFTGKEMVDNDRHIDSSQRFTTSNRQIASIFIWESFDLAMVLRCFTDACNSVLCGQTDFEKFAGELASALEWIIGHCSALQDVSDLREQKAVKELLELPDEQIEDQESNELFGKLSSLEAEPDGELEAACLELRILEESVPKIDLVPEEKEPRSGWEISAASDKLAECQETILQLGRQLKAMSSPNEAALLDNALLSPAVARKGRSLQLIEQLIAIDNANFDDFKSNALITLEKQDASFLNGQKGLAHPVSRNQMGAEVGALVSLSKKQKSGISFLKRLISRKKSSSVGRNLLSMPMPLPAN